MPNPTSIEKDSVVPFPLDGKLFWNTQRVFITTTAAMGLLRKDLIEMVGKKRMNQFLVRYGWSVGVYDATQILENESYTSIEEMILAGPKLHMQRGYVHAQPKVLELDPNNKSFYMEGIWKHSYEAEEHQKLFGIDDGPTCYTLVGYASGYLSTVLGMMIIVKEIDCEGKGDNQCHWIAKPVDAWKEQAAKELFNFNETSMIQELELAYDKIKEERDNLNKSFKIHKLLTKQLVQGNNLQSIADVLFETLDVPIMFEDHQFSIIAAAGLDETEQKLLNQQMNGFIQSKKQRFKEIQLEFQKEFKAAKLHIAKNHIRLMIPILSNHKITGYCSIIRQTDEFSILENMMIERTSLVCAMYLLNEQTAIEAEQRMRGNILEEILKGRLCKQEIMRMGQYVDVNFQEPFHIVVINICNADEISREEIEWKDSFSTKLLEYLKKLSGPILLTYQADRLVLYVSNKILDQINKQIRDLTQEILTYCSKLYPKLTFYSGISTCSEKIELAKSYYEEALTATNLSTKSKPITSYEDLGIIGLLMQTGNREAIRKYSLQALHDLLEYDNRKGMDLTKTLYHYILNGGNLEQTACSSALSISGLRYRVEKIKDILSIDIRQPANSYPLFLAIQMLIILGELQFD